jgi:DNA-binding response OmpR family regulator
MASNLRILVIDDSMVSRRQVQLALTDYTVDVAATSALGLEAARQNRPQLLLLDDTLPDTTLATFLTTHAKEAPLAGVPIVILADNRDTNLAPLRELNESLVEVLYKPLSREGILECAELAVYLPQKHGTTGSNLSPEVTAQLSTLIGEALHWRLANIPRWESERGTNTPTDYYRAKILLPAVLNHIVTRCVEHLPSRQNLLPKVVLWDAQRHEVTEPLLAWLNRKHHLTGIDVSQRPDPTRAIAEETPRLVVLSAETVGPSIVQRILEQVTRSNPEATVLVTCELANLEWMETWWKAGADDVLLKPFLLSDVEKWLVPLTPDAKA